MTRPYNGDYPKIDSTCFIAQTASVVGKVTLGEYSSVWYSVAIRGDVEPVVIGKGTNIQDNASIHVNEGFGVSIGDNVTIGHNAVVHGCSVGNNCLIGVGSVILDGARIGDNCIIGAGAVVTKNVEIPANSVVMGVPGRVVREATSEDILKNTSKANDFIGFAQEMIRPITIRDIVKNSEINVFMKMVETQLEANGYTEHSYRHVGLVAKNAADILKKLGKTKREIELAEIAGFLHDIGNAVNRVDHAHNGGMIAYNFLTKLGMHVDEAAEVMLAISNHDEGSGIPVSNISAALILADKSDVHRSRVKNRDFSTFDIHDRVNYAVVSSKIDINTESKEAILTLKIDVDICPIMDYFEIFLDRMTMSRKAAEYLGLTFRLTINESKLL